MRFHDNVALHLLALLVAGCAIFLPELGRDEYMSGTEARHAEIAREMAETGRYMVPHSVGRAYTDKPPLYNWAVAGLFRMTGRADMALARLPIALASVLMAPAIYLLGRRWRNARTGLWSAAIWLTCPLVVTWGRMARSDMLMSCLILYALLLAMWGADSRQRRAAWGLWCLSGMFLAAAVMSKGPQPLLFLGPMVVAVWRAERRRWLPPAGYIAASVTLVVLAVVAWLAACEAGNPGHLKQLVGYEFGDAFHQHPQPLHFYVNQLAVYTAPWALFVIGAAYAAVRRARRSGYDQSLIPAAVLVVGLVGLTIMPNKKPHYLLPILPMWALFIGMFLDRAAPPGPYAATASKSEQDAPGPAPRWLFTVPLYICLVGFAAGAIVFPVTLRPETGFAPALVILCAGVAAFSAYGAVAAFRGRAARAVGVLVITALVLSAATHPVLNRFVREPDPRHGVTEEIARLVPPDAPLAGYRMPSSASFEILFFTLNRPVQFPQTEVELNAFLREPEARYLLVRPEQVARATELSRRDVREVRRWLLREGKKTNIVLLEVAAK